MWNVCLCQKCIVWDKNNWASYWSCFLSHFAGNELSSSVYIQYNRLVCVHSPCQERDHALVSECLLVCLILPLAFGFTVLWLGCVVQYRALYPNFLQLCLVCINSIYFDWPHMHTNYTGSIHSFSVHVALVIIWKCLYSIYDAAVPAVFTLSVMSISNRKIHGLTVFRCSRPHKIMLHICSKNMKNSHCSFGNPKQIYIF